VHGSLPSPDGIKVLSDFPPIFSPRQARNTQMQVAIPDTADRTPKLRLHPRRDSRPMNEKDYQCCQALKRVSTFATNHAAAFPAGSQAAAGFARVGPLLAEIGDDDLTAGVPASPATGSKAARFDEVWEDLKAIAATARTIALDEPGFAAGFLLGESTQQAILATAEDFLEKLATPATVAKFVAYDLPADFVTDLQDDLAAIDGDADDQAEDRQDATGDTARIRALVREGRDLLKRLDTSVRNRFRNDPEVLAEWRTAARIHRAPRATPAEPPTPAPAPAG
jgi:hypothetical protein